MQGRNCRNFAHNLAGFVESHDLPVYLYNEAMTTMGAELSLKSRRTVAKYGSHNVDSLAAVELLKAYYADPSCAMRVASM